MPRLFKPFKRRRPPAPVVTTSTDAHLFAKAREFTDTEDQTLNAWLVAENAGLEENAEAVLDSGLMVEHFRSLLDADPAKITNEQNTQLRELQRQFEKDLNELTEELIKKAEGKG
jgi:hypothetical protein